MGYYLGVDIGTSYTAAAVWRAGLVEAVMLGDRTPVIPSVVLLRENGEVLTGEAAERAGATEPLRVAREFRRRLGDATPVTVDGERHPAEDLTAHLVRSVVETVREREGGAATAVTASHPLNWSESRRAGLRRAFALAGVDDLTLVADPHAAALHHGAQDGSVGGAVVGVYDLGGGTFDAAVLFATDSGWEPLGRPEGIDRLGGVDVDEAVFNHVADELGGALDVLDPDDPTALAAVARLRQACVEAKEALSARSDVSVPVTLPTLRSSVRLTRADLEKMVRPSLAPSVEALGRTLRSAGVETSDLTAMLLMGEASRMPLVAQLVGSQLERPVAVAAEPKLGVALGAAIAAAGRDVADAAATTRVRSVVDAALAGAGARPARREAALAGVGDRSAGRSSGPDATAFASPTSPGPNGAGASPAATRPFAPVGPLPARSGAAGPPAGAPTRDRQGNWTLWLVTGGIVAAAIVAVIVFTSSGSGGGDNTRSDRPSTTVTDGATGGTGGTGSTVTTAQPPGGAPRPTVTGPAATVPTTPPTFPDPPPTTVPRTTVPPTTAPAFPPTTAPPAFPPPAP
jgi:actin-like ATPase involved in cell morphogenesis